MSPGALTSLSACELAALVARREVSALEVTRAHVERLAELRDLNALAFPDFEGALRRARELDERQARGETLGPLHGVPFTVKDWLDAAGLPCVGADPRYRGRVPDQDAAAVARLRAAGGVVLGKSAVLTESEVYGRVVNPRGTDPLRPLSPGGSSSGEAALIAAHGSPLGLGSDSGGSIRQPAGFCGVAGLKPTSGRVPLTGHFPCINPLADPRTVIGPLARRVDDLTLALGLIAGEDGVDPSAVPVPLRDPRAVTLKGLRVAFYTDLEDEGGPQRVTPEVRGAILTAAATLAWHGGEVREEAPPHRAEAMRLTRQYWGRPESSSWTEWDPEGTHSTLTADEVERHLFDWDVLRRDLLRFMASADVILTPIAERTAAPHGEPFGTIEFTAPYSLAGMPAVTVPAAWTADGLPVGVQVVSRLWREDVALAVAQVLETPVPRVQALGAGRLDGDSSPNLPGELG